MAKDMIEALTKQRPLIQRPPFAGFTPIKGESVKTMFADAIAAKADMILHVDMLENAKDAATKQTALAAQYTLYEPRKNAAADKPLLYWQKAVGEQIKTVAPEINLDTFDEKTINGKVPHDAYQLMAIDLQSAMIKRFATIKSIAGKSADKDTLTVTVTVLNSGKSRIRAMVLALPQEGYVKYCHVAEEMQPGETKKVIFQIAEPGASTLAWKSAKLSEIYLDRGATAEEQKKP
jgi:hypothetical protein